MLSSLALLASLASPALAAAPSHTEVEAKTRNLLQRDATGLGVGVILGAPTGLSVAWQPAASKVSYDGAVAWSFARPGLAVHADLRVELADRTTPDIPDTHFRLTAGLGPRVRLGDPPGDASDAALDVGVRVPFALNISHEGFPLEGFVELAPGMAVFPETGFLFDGAVGFRFYVPAPKKRAAAPVLPPPPPSDAI
jgi:hypothetical protein